MTLNDIESKLASLEEKAKSLSSNKLWFLLLLLPVIILKYRSIIIDLLIKDSNKIVNDTTKKDNVLASEQQAASVQADQILKDANDAKEKSDQETVTADWNVKK